MNHNIVPILWYISQCNLFVLTVGLTSDIRLNGSNWLEYAEALSVDRMYGYMIHNTVPITWYISPEKETMQTLCSDGGLILMKLGRVGIDTISVNLM